MTEPMPYVELNGFRIGRVAGVVIVGRYLAGIPSAWTFTSWAEAMDFIFDDEETDINGKPRRWQS